MSPPDPSADAGISEDEHRLSPDAVSVIDDTPVLFPMARRHRAPA